MKDPTKRSAAPELYAEAYAAHYTDRDLSHALQLYRQLLASFPNSAEARHSRMQVLNIVNAVVPEQERLDAAIDLALVHLGAPRPVSTVRPATPRNGLQACVVTSH